MNKLRVCLAVSGASLLIVLSGMFSAPPAHAQGSAQLAKPPPGRALVFVFRSDREAAAAEVPVSVNAEAVGQLADGTFLVATVNPGRTFVRAGDRVVSAVALQAEPNRSYFVKIEAVSGVRPVRTETRLVSEAEGRGSVAQSRPVGGAAPAIIAAPRGMPSAPKPAPPPAVKPAPAPQIAKPAPPPQIAKPAAVARAPAPEVSDAGWDIAIIAKAGIFKMANGSQMVGTPPSTYTYDTTSKPVLGMEIEWRSRAGLALGGEVFYYKNELVATGTTAEQEVFATMLNGKYYFRAADWFYPFVGAGIGFAGASYGGGLTGKASGPAYQGLAGMEFRFEGVGLHAQFKYLAATIDDGTGAKVKVGGSGVLAGVSFIF